jgi:hypothetical protein
MYCIEALPAALVAGTGAIDNIVGIQVSTAGITTVTDLYGIRVDDLTEGTNSNYAIQTGLGDVSFGDDTTVNGNLLTTGLTTTDELIITNPTTDFRITGRSNSLAIEAVTSGYTALGLYTNDGDGLDTVDFIIYGKGTTSSVANRERLITRYDASKFTIFTEAGGTGSATPLEFRSSTNINQLLLNTDGSVNMAGNLTVSGVIEVANKVIVTNSATSFGRGNAVNSPYATALGNSNSINSGSYGSSAIGYGNFINGWYSSAVGYKNDTGDYNESSAFGSRNISDGQSSSAVGYKNTTAQYYPHQSSFGANCSAYGYRASAFGYKCSATNDNSSAFGYKVANSTSNSTKIGINAVTLDITSAGQFTMNGDLDVTGDVESGTAANGTFLTSTPVAISGDFVNTAGSGVARHVIQGATPLLNIVDTDGALNEKVLAQGIIGGDYKWVIANDNLTTKITPLIMDMTDGDTTFASEVTSTSGSFKGKHKSSGGSAGINGYIANSAYGYSIQFNDGLITDYYYIGIP